MLESLYVKNLALIDELEVSFRDGLNILTGETGAGKSIILGSVNMALGQRANKDMIRDGEEYALIELLFRLETKEQEQLVREMELPIEDGCVLIQRKMNANRSSCRVNGETVSQKQLQELADCLIDIHGQQDTAFLRNPAKHLEILDNFCGNELEQLLETLRPIYSEYRSVLSELSEGDRDDNRKQREIDLLEYEYREIQEAALVAGEDGELENRYHRMKNGKKLATTMGMALELMGNDSENSVGTQLNRAIRELMSIHGMDNDADSIISAVSQIDGMLSDTVHDIRKFVEDLEFSEEEFREVEDRLNVINRLKDKYGNTIEAILRYAEDCEQKLDRLHHLDEYRKDLESRRDALLVRLDEMCSAITALRCDNARRLSEELRSSLEGLNFLSVQCELRMDTLPDYTASGRDSAAFYISLNPGERMRPLSEIASGGELSRIMLGLKTILADQDPGKTFIFDEIDAGISGKTAWSVSEKMGILAKNHQMICITHLAQIAAMADHHYEIRKSVHDGITTTGIRELSEQASVEELGRLLGSDTITDAVRRNAEELRTQALDVKRKI